MFSQEDPYALAASVVRLPARFLVTGRSEMGKTTGAVHMVADIFCGQYDRLITVCPTFYTQKAFRAFDRYIRSPNDVITEPNKHTFRNIKLNVLRINTKRAREGKRPLHTFVFVDDLAGTNFIQDRRIGDFSNLAIQTPHLNMSMLVITQQASSVSPAYRDNTNVVLAFPAQRQEELDWLKKEFKNPSIDNNAMKEIINNAWRGGRCDDKEWGEHFLTIYAPSRKKLTYFGDFIREIYVPDTYTPKSHHETGLTLYKRHKRTRIHAEDGPPRKKHRSSKYELDVE